MLFISMKEVQLQHFCAEIKMENDHYWAVLSEILCSSFHLSHPVNQCTPFPLLSPVLIPTVPNERHEVTGASRHCFDGSYIFRCQLQVRAAATQTIADVLPRPSDA